nr:MAG TPA: hypothetical protein [Microviridae sp.]
MGVWDHISLDVYGPSDTTNFKECEKCLCL